MDSTSTPQQPHNVDDELLNRVSKLIKIPHVEHENDVRLFLNFVWRAWDAVNNILRSIKLSRTLIPEALCQGVTSISFIVLAQNRVIEEITLIRNDIQSFLYRFQKGFGNWSITGDLRKIEEILIISIEGRKITTDLEIVVDLVQKLRRFENAFKTNMA